MSQKRKKSNIKNEMKKLDDDDSNNNNHTVTFRKL